MLSGMHKLTLTEIMKDFEFKEDVDSDEEETSFEAVIAHSECTQLSTTLDTLVKKYLAPCFEKQLVLDHLFEFKHNLENDAKRLYAWRMLFQELQHTCLFLHTLIENPIPMQTKIVREFNDMRKVALQMVTLRGQAMFGSDGVEHDMHYLNGDQCFYEQAVITRFLDPQALATALITTLGSEADLIGQKTGGPLNHKNLISFISHICSSMRMVRYAIEIIDHQLLYVDTTQLQNHISPLQQVFCFYDETILNTEINTFLKVDKCQADIKKMRIANDSAGAQELLKQLLVVQLFAFEGIKVALPQYIAAQKIPQISPEYQRELKLKVDAEASITEIRLQHLKESKDDHPQVQCIHTYFDYVMFYIHTAKIRRLTLPEAISETTTALFQIKHHIDCLVHLINALRKNQEIYQHAALDQKFKTLTDNKKVSQAPKLRPPKPAPEEKKILGSVMQDTFTQLHEKIETLRRLRDTFYELYNPAIKHTAVKSQKKRLTLLTRFKTSMINVVMAGLDRHAQTLADLKIRYQDDKSQEELEQCQNNLHELEALADQTIRELKELCNRCNLLAGPTPPPSPLVRRHSDNSAKKSQRAMTPRSAIAGPAKPPGNDMPPLDINLSSLTGTELLTYLDARIAAALTPAEATLYSELKQRTEALEARTYLGEKIIALEIECEVRACLDTIVTTIAARETQQLLEAKRQQQAQDVAETQMYLEEIIQKTADTVEIETCLEAIITHVDDAHDLQLYLDEIAATLARQSQPARLSAREFREQVTSDPVHADTSVARYGTAGYPGAGLFAPERRVTTLADLYAPRFSLTG